MKNATSKDETAKFEATVKFFRKYGDQYKLDYLLMMAQGYQESKLDQNARSPSGAIGVMQVLPATGKAMNVGDITKIEPNIHAGVKYIRFMMKQYYADEPMDPLNKGLFAFASYNVGPGRIAQLRKEAAKRGLDPNKWFNNVEVIAAEKQKRMKQLSFIEGMMTVCGGQMLRPDLRRPSMTRSIRSSNFM